MVNNQLSFHNKMNVLETGINFNSNYFIRVKVYLFFIFDVYMKYLQKENTD